MEPTEGWVEGDSAQTIGLVGVMILVAAATFGLLVWWSYHTGDAERWPLAERFAKRPSATAQPASSSGSMGYSFSGGRVAITGLRRAEAGGEVILTNQGGASQVLSGWYLCKGEEKCFSFPEGFLLEPGVSVRIWSGRAEPKEALLGFHWTEQEMWSEPHACIVLRDASGEIVSRFEY